MAFRFRIGPLTFGGPSEEEKKKQAAKRLFRAQETERISVGPPATVATRAADLDRARQRQEDLKKKRRGTIASISGILGEPLTKKQKLGA